MLSLNSTVINFTPRVFPTDGVLIAPFWADVDIRGIGSIYYRITSNETLLNRFSMDITSSFTGQVIFSPQILFIATWSEVGYFSMHTDKVQYNSVTIPLIRHSQAIILVSTIIICITEQYLSMRAGYKWRSLVCGLPVQRRRNSMDNWRL